MDRDRLAFGDDIVELDEKRRDSPCRRRETGTRASSASTNATSLPPATLSPTSTGNTQMRPATFAMILISGMPIAFLLSSQDA
jgi:hypothetical protein